MNKKKGKRLWYALAGGAAGVVNGFFGGGGGQVLVPMLAGKCALEQRKAFATSVAVIAPLCALSAAIYWFRGSAGSPAGPALPGRRAHPAALWGEVFKRPVHDLAAPGLSSLLILYGGDDVRFL